MRGSRSGTPQSFWPAALRRAWQRLGATAHAETRGPAIILLVQGADPTDVVHHADLGSTPGGVGLTRTGLDGLQLSIRDAEKAMAPAANRQGGVIDFETEWFAAALSAQRRELGPVLRPRRSRLPGHLADAVSAYAAHGFSISAASQALHAHPNTIKYRLQRWHQLTGWNPRTLDGLLKSPCSLALVAWDGSGEADDRAGRLRYPHCRS